MIDAVCCSSRTLKCSNMDSTRRITAMNKFLYNKRDNRVLAMKVLCNIYFFSVSTVIT